MVYAVVIAILNRGYYRGSSIQRTIRSSNSVFSLDLNVRLDLCSLGYVRWSWEENFKTLKDLCNLFKLHVRKFPVQTNFPRLRNTLSFLLILDNYPRRICLRFLPPTHSYKIIQLEMVRGIDLMSVSWFPLILNITHSISPRNLRPRNPLKCLILRIKSFQYF